MISFRSRAAALALATVGALVMPASSIAACDQWNLTGRWQFWQGNNLKVQFDLVQDAAGQIRGSGTYLINTPNIKFHERVNGSIEQGSIKGNTFLFVADWVGSSSPTRGRYVGTVKTDGAITGVASDLSNSSQTFPFHEFDGRKAACAPTPSSASTSTPPSSAPKKTVTLGKMKDVATAIDDVDIHAAPDGQSRKLGFLKAGGTGTVVGHQPGWYQLKDLSVDLVEPVGWIAEDHLKVKRVRR